MAKINNQPPQPNWPWGAEKQVRERLVNPAQLARTKKKEKTGDPKKPALASAALIDFIGPAHSAEELRLPLPPNPQQEGGALLGAYSDHPALASVAERSEDHSRHQLERGLGMINASPERMERLKALLGAEAAMLSLVGELDEEMKEIQRRIKLEQAGEGY